MNCCGAAIANFKVVIENNIIFVQLKKADKSGIRINFSL